jgi:hypothetical protein
MKRLAIMLHPPPPRLLGSLRNKGAKRKRRTDGAGLMVESVVYCRIESRLFRPNHF